MLKNLREEIQQQGENLREQIEEQLGARSTDSHVNSFNDGDEFFPDDRSTPVHKAIESPNLPIIPESNEDMEGMRNTVNFEDSPVKPGVDGRNVKSFEELLELSILNESLVMGRVDKDEAKPILKRPFLKKGSGIEARFKPKKVLKRTCQLGKQSNENGVQPKLSENPVHKKPIVCVKTVNVLPRTDTRAPIAKKTATVTGNPLKFHKIPARGVISKSKAPDTSLDNLERLLVTVRSRKEELLRLPQSSSSSSEDSCWENEEEDEFSEPEESFKNYHSKKKVRWNDIPSKMSKAKVGVYSKSVQNYMASLENKLFELQKRCASKIEKKEQPPKNTEINEEIAKEISDLRSQIAVIADGIKTLQLYTSNLKANETKKIPRNKQPRVTITRSLPQELDLDTKRKSCFEEDTSVKFGNGDQMQVLNDGTVVSIKLILS